MDLLRPFCSTQLLWYGDMTSSALLEIPTTAATASPKTNGLATSWDCSALWATPAEMPQLFVNRWTSTADLRSKVAMAATGNTLAPLLPRRGYRRSEGKLESLNIQTLGVVSFCFSTTFPLPSQPFRAWLARGIWGDVGCVALRCQFWDLGESPQHSCGCDPWGRPGFIMFHPEKAGKIWRFPKHGVPSNHPFNIYRIFHYKPSILG